MHLIQEYHNCIVSTVDFNVIEGLYDLEIGVTVLSLTRSLWIFLMFSSPSALVSSK